MALTGAGPAERAVSVYRPGIVVAPWDAQIITPSVPVGQTILRAVLLIRDYTYSKSIDIGARDGMALKVAP